jgi:Rad3-related DNA helicase
MFSQNNKTPADYGLPHQGWREHQQDAIHWAEGLDSTGILAAPTGSGKTALPAALSHDSRVVSLVRTKNLQREIYGNAYGFDVLFGRSNHPCHHPENFRGATAEDCLFGSAMFRCEHKDSCSYLIDKHTARGSKRASLNFAYALIGLKRWPSFDYLVLDEAHLASETVLDFVGIKLHEGHRITWELPQFPRVGTPKPFTQQAPDRIVAWLQESSRLLDLQRLTMIERWQSASAC